MEQAASCPAAVHPEAVIGIYHLSSLPPISLPYSWSAFFLANPGFSLGSNTGVFSQVIYETRQVVFPSLPRVGPRESSTKSQM